MINRKVIIENTKGMEPYDLLVWYRFYYKVMTVKDCIWATKFVVDYIKNYKNGG